MNPVRVLFPFAGDTGLGGSHISALSLAAALDPAEFIPHVLVHLEDGAVAAHARTLGLEVEILAAPPLMGSPGLRMPADVGLARYLAESLPSLCQTLARIDPTIVHTNEGRMHANWILPARVTGRKHIWHHRQDPMAMGVNWLAPLLSHHIVTVSEFSRPAKPVRPVHRKLSVIRSPFEFSESRIDRSAAHEALCKELGLPVDAVILGFFGSIIDRKRPMLFVEALQRVAHALPDRAVHGAVFGEFASGAPNLGPEDLRARASQLGIADRLHIMGFRQDIERYIAAVDATVVTAVNEPFGRTLIESMHLGTPVIATRHGGNPEAIRDCETGFLVQPECAAAFVDPLLRLLHDPALHAQMTAAARKDAVEHYGRERHVEQISRLYHDLLA